MKTTFAVTAIVFALAVGGAGAVGQLGDTVKQAGEATKETTKQAGEATKHAVKTTGEKTKQGAKASKDAVTGKSHATCVDGTKHTAATAKAARAACGKHGGVAK